MKANELMIGDWVSLTKTGDIAPCVVTALHPKEVFVLQPEWSAGEVVSYDTVYPIPLTKEILEKNGWHNVPYSRSQVRDGKWPYSRFQLQDGKWLDFYWYGRGLQEYWRGIVGWQNHSEQTELLFSAECIYDVHQLQHALRLCGLNDLADNFKV